MTLATHETPIWDPEGHPIGPRGAEVKLWQYAATITDYAGDSIVLDWEELRALLKTLVVHATPQLSTTKENTHG